MTGHCSICGKKGTVRRGWCAMHYQRWHRYGTPEGIRRTGQTFTRAHWDKWLAELNSTTAPYAAGIHDFRQRCAAKEPQL